MWRAHRQARFHFLHQGTIVDDGLPVDQHVAHADRVAGGLFVGGHVAHRIGIEHHDIGVRARRQPAAPCHFGNPPLEALCAGLMTELRGALRGRSMADLLAGVEAPPEVAQEALTLLLARGAVVRRGHKYFAA